MKELNLDLDDKWSSSARYKDLPQNDKKLDSDDKTKTKSKKPNDLMEKRMHGCMKYILQYNDYLVCIVNIELVFLSILSKPLD